MKTFLEKVQEIQYGVDATPDEYYPIRILQAYRQLCNNRWFPSSGYSEEELPPLMKALNDMNEKRAELLDKSIALLKEYVN